MCARVCVYDFGSCNQKYNLCITHVYTHTHTHTHIYIYIYICVCVCVCVFVVVDVCVNDVLPIEGTKFFFILC